MLKWRPDFIARHSFLRDKILEFDRLCEPPDNTCFGVAMPPRVFREKLWIPWADSNSPFFYEDAVFLGRRQDAEKLVTPIAPADIEILGDALCGSYAHVVRYGKPFAARYPLLETHFRLYRYFLHHAEYRRRLVPYLVDNGFYWHVLIAHAWIMHSHFHVDIGARGDLAFYANAVNREADWSRFETLKVQIPMMISPTGVGARRRATRCRVSAAYSAGSWTMAGRRRSSRRNCRICLGQAWFLSWRMSRVAGTGASTSLRRNSTGRSKRYSGHTIP